MKWEELSNATRNILERCWFSSHSDHPTTFEVKLGTLLYKEEDKVTMENFEEILAFQKSNPHFNVWYIDLATNNQIIKVAGAYDFREWDSFDYTLTENGAKEELAVNDEVYFQYSFDITNISKRRIKKVNKNEYVLDNGIRIKKADLTATNHTTVIRLETHQVFVSRESVYLKKAYERLQLEEQFESLFHLKSVKDDTLIKLINILEDAEVY